jgi:undecaprenyl-diphosphatase
MHSPGSVIHRFFAMLGSHELAVLLGFAGLVGGVWFFCGIAGEMMEGDTQAIDQRLLLAMRHRGDLSPLGSPSVQDAARDITALGGVTVLTLVAAMTGGFLFLDGKRRMALFVYGSVAGGAILDSILKGFFQRPRPDLVPHAAYASSTSFPSGHSMLSAVTYLTLGALLARSHPRNAVKAYFILLAALLTLLVGVSRVYLGVHWPTDVLAGWTAGASWAIFCWLAARWLQGRQAIEAETGEEEDAQPIANRDI